jgi:hypothetical protein
VDYGTGGVGGSVAIGDVSRDGKPDLAVTNQSSNTVSVLLGNGDGSFGASVDYGTGGVPISVAIGDLSGDGKADLAVANYGGAVSVLLGNGDGTFGAKADYGAGNNPRSVAIGDVSGDGKQDIAVANGGSSTVSVLLGNGDGTFETKVDYGAGSEPYSIAIGDVSGDGKPDLAVANNGSSTVSILLNIGPRSQALAAVVDLDPNVINQRSHAPWITAYIEPTGLDLASIDLSTLRLAGSVPAVSKSAIVGDHDNDGAPDLMVKFSRRALDALLTPGVNELEVTGSLVTGEAFKGSDEVRVIDPPSAPLSASVAPNPLNPAGALTLHTTVPGPARVQMFDLQGRLVRTLLEGPLLPAGAREVGIDGRGNRGEALASGVYFYRVETAEGVVTGRVVILK